jgi:hypothetical protein
MIIPAYNINQANNISMIDRLEQVKDKCLELSDKQFIDMDLTDRKQTIRFFDNMASEQVGINSKEARIKAQPFIIKSSHLILLFQNN